MFENEKIIENKICKHCKSSFEITDKDLEFYEKISPSFGGKKYLIPTPNLCPDCRQQRRLSFRNERKLYKRKCDASGENIISIYSHDKPYKVYNQDFWRSDNWDAIDYGKEIDFNKSLFEQFGELILKVPKRAVVKGTGSDNCDYVNYVGASKDCYLIFDATNNENCYYSNGIVDCKDCIDSSLIRKSDNCYSCIDTISCYNCFSLQNCNNCSYSSYLINCENCNNCIFCINLFNKKYCIGNKQYSKEEYLKKAKKIIINQSNFDYFNKFKNRFPYKNIYIINSENSSGNTIINSRNIKNSYEIYDSENISYSVNIYKSTKDCLDVNVGLNNSFLVYESSIINKECSNILFSFDCWNNCHFLLYCSECKVCSYCFMCNGLVHKSYCILNKQYTKEEYNKLVPKIIEHMQNSLEWGEFFPSSLSPFGYNETVAQEYFPIEIKTGLSNKDIKYIDTEGNNYKDLKEAGERPVFKYSDYESPIPKVDKIIPASKLPENISDIPDDILNWAIECEITKKPFRIIKEELEFYRKHNLPIPRRHPDQRHLDRMKLRNPRKLFDRKCGKCKKDIKTTYSQERKEIIYCEECYNKEIY